MGTRALPPGVERGRGDRHAQRTQDRRPARRARGPVHGHRRRRRRHERPGDRAAARRRLLRRLVLVLRQARDQGRPCRPRDPGAGPRALRDRRGSRAARRHPDAARVHVARAAAQRLRDRSRSEPRRGLRDPGHPPGARPGRAARGARPRAQPREAPRHPHRVRRRSRRARDHLRGAHGVLVRRRQQRHRVAAHDDPRPDGGHAHPDGDLALARVRSRRRRCAPVRQRRAARPCAREDRGVRASRCR